jgi:hypothetical protein
MIWVAGSIVVPVLEAERPLSEALLCGFDGISTESDPSWGRVAAPSSGTAYYLLDYLSGTVSSLTPGGYAFNDGQNGIYIFKGPAFQPISYNVTFGAFNDTGISVVSTVINGYTNTAGTGIANSLGNYTLKVGGTLAVTQAATVETHYSTITLTVNYQ